MFANRSAATKLDLAGAGLLIATAAWFAVPWVDRGGSSGPALAVLGVAAGGFLLARASALWVSPLLPAVLVVGAAGAALLVSGGGSAPLGYANANGIYFALASFAGLTLCAATRARAVAGAALVVGVVFGIATLITGSLAASALLVLAPVAGLATLSRQGRMAVPACAGVFLVALAASVALGLTYSGQDSAASSALTSRRLALWHDALGIVGQYPLTGAGFDRFQELSPTAQSDPDARLAHNEFLQVGAETGIAGLVLVASLFLWGFARLAVEPISARSTLAAAGLAAVGVHASVDYVLHFLAVPLSAAVLVGAALAPREGRSASQ